MLRSQVCLGLCVCCPGNHETDNMNQMYGFEGEVKAKYTAQMFQLFSEVFQWLPLAQCINGKVLVSTLLHLCLYACLVIQLFLSTFCLSHTVIWYKMHLSCHSHAFQKLGRWIYGWIYGCVYILSPIL